MGGHDLHAPCALPLNLQTSSKPVLQVVGVAEDDVAVEVKQLVAGEALDRAWNNKWLLLLRYMQFRRDPGVQPSRPKQCPRQRLALSADGHEHGRFGREVRQRHECGAGPSLGRNHLSA